MEKKIYFRLIMVLLGFSQFLNAQPSLNIAPTSIEAGENTCLAVTVADFTDLTEINLSLSWDKTVLDYQTVTNFHPQVTDLDINNFTVTNDEVLELSWSLGDCNDNLINSVTLTDQSVLFEICFDGIGSEGAFTTVDFDPGFIVYRKFANCANIGLFPQNGFVWIAYGSSPDCPMVISGSEATGSGLDVGDTYCIDVFADGMSHSNHFNYIVDYRPDNLSDLIFDTVYVRNFEFPNLSEQNFDFSTPGIIKMSWENNFYFGANVSGNVKLHQICFDIGIFPLTNIDYDFYANVTNLDTELRIGNSCITHTSCPQDPMADINVSILGGTPPYSYVWAGPDNYANYTQVVTDVVPGLYTLIVTDITGASITSDFEILALAGEETISLNVCESECALWGNPFPCADGTYQSLIPTQNGNCDSLFYMVVDVMEFPITDLGNIDICGGSCVTFAAMDYCDPGYYEVYFTSYFGCDSIVGFTVVDAGTNGGLIQDITPDTVLCDLSNFQLEVIAPDAVSFQWYPTDNLSCVNCPNPTAMPLFNTQYIVIATDVNGCTEEASVFLEIPFGLDWGLFPWSNSPVCVGDDILFSSQIPNNIIAYQWTGPGAFSTIDENPIITNADFSNSGFYNVTVTDVNGCTGVAEFYVDVVDEPIADAGADAILDCVSTQALLNGNGSSIGGNIIFEWFNEMDILIDDVQNVTVSEAGIYTLVVTDLDTGCSATDQVEVITDVDLPIITFSASYICYGNAFDYCADVSGGSGNYAYEWVSPGGGIANTECYEFTNFQTDQDGMYTLTVTDIINGCSNFGQIVLEGNECVWPGDTDTNKVVNNFDLLNIGLAFDSIGPSRTAASLNWEGQLADPWTQSTPDGVNYMHVDTDGNGLINADDTLAITQNWGLTHNLWQADDRNVGAPFYVQGDTLTEDSTYAMPVILGDMDFPAENVYGIAFTLAFDTSIVTNNASVNFGNSWLGAINSNMIAIQKPAYYTQGGKLDIAVTKIDGQNMTGFGQVGTFYITIEDIIFQSPPDGNPVNLEKELIFRIENVRMIDFQGEEIEVDTEPEPSVSTATNATILAQQIKVFPNPVENILTIQSPTFFMENIEVFSLTGQSVLSNFEKGNQIEIEVNDWLPGVYFLKIQTNEGIALKKILVK